MDIKQIKDCKKQGGFTLVELAIVMIIIGLLIGGALKGQELIANAQVGATVAQTKAYEAAVSTFRDSYGVFPGDMPGTPANRIPNCGVVCAQDGDGNNQIGNDPGLAHPNLTNENGTAWAQLAAADLITGVNQTAGIGVAPIGGTSIPAAAISGASWQIGYVATVLTAATAAANPRSGHYILLDNSLAVASSAAVGGISSGQAARIDRKIDDGSPNTGTARAMGGVTATDCVDGTANDDAYREAIQTLNCGLYVRIQQ